MCVDNLWIMWKTCWKVSLLIKLACYYIINGQNVQKLYIFYMIIIYFIYISIYWYNYYIILWYRGDSLHISKAEKVCMRPITSTRNGRIFFIFLVTFIPSPLYHPIYPYLPILRTSPYLSTYSHSLPLSPTTPYYLFSIYFLFHHFLSYDKLNIFFTTYTTITINYY
jgi:hypothetical protein